MDRVSTPLRACRGDRWRVSIPRSGWIVFQPLHARHGRSEMGCFNPSFGMDRVSTDHGVVDLNQVLVSIPRSGWIVFQRAALTEHDHRLMFQSLVRDGSCFNDDIVTGKALTDRFNPSFGMDRVSTFTRARVQSQQCRFQSLVRDGSCFNHCGQKH